MSHCWSDVRTSWATGWTRTTANSGRVLVQSGGCAGRGGSSDWFQASYYSGRTALGAPGTDPRADVSGSVWLNRALLAVLAGQRSLPPCFSLLFFLSWHCAWSGERASACFSNSPLGGREAGRGHTSLLCRGKRTQWSASNHQNDWMIDGVSK